MDLENGPQSDGPKTADLDATRGASVGEPASANGEPELLAATPDSPESAVGVDDVAVETPADVETAAEEPERNVISEWVITIILLLFGTSMIVQAFVIPTGSMIGTLLIGDHLLVDKLAYAPSGAVSRFILPYRPVKRGDIIVFRYPLDVSQTYVKRAIGLPGDRIRIIDRVVSVNGRELKEPYAIYKADHIDDYKHRFPSEPAHYLRREAREMIEHNVDQDTGELVVPQDSYFAMGDNRDESDDSRYWGFVPRGNIIGKPLVVYWSFNATTEALQDPSISLSHTRDVIVNFFTKTRWNRTFRPVRGHPLE